MLDGILPIKSHDHIYYHQSLKCLISNSSFDRNIKSNNRFIYSNSCELLYNGTTFDRIKI